MKTAEGVGVLVNYRMLSSDPRIFSSGYFAFHKASGTSCVLQAGTSIRLGKEVAGRDLGLQGKQAERGGSFRASALRG